MTDKERILSHLRLHKSITPMEALNEFGCYRLAARIADLRHDGHTIDTEIVSDKDRYGEPMRYAKYTLSGDKDARKIAP